MPVVERVKLGGDPILILESLVEEKLRIELELEVVAAQVLHVILDYDLDGFPCRKKTNCRLPVRRVMYGYKDFVVKPEQKKRKEKKKCFLVKPEKVPFTTQCVKLRFHSTII